ncbi:MAG: cytochrome C, partial [Bryobacteraceae bacterium]|nr:cytochrome C [Bryobacteraceae bacterium]
MPEGSLRQWLSPLVYLSGNWISRVGVVAVTTASVLWLFQLPLFLRGEVDNPYRGILTFLVLPAVFFGGLVLIPLGMVREARRRRKRGEQAAILPALHWRSPEVRRLLTFVGVTTVANIIIGLQLTYRAAHYMDSVTFCGKTCHKVMAPEFTAYQDSP